MNLKRSTEIIVTKECTIVVYFQVSVMQNLGKEMMIITSGAVAIGRQTLRSELSMQQTMRDSLRINPRRRVCQF